MHNKIAFSYDYGSLIELTPSKEEERLMLALVGHLIQRFMQRAEVSGVTRSLTCHMPLTVKIQSRHSSRESNIIRGRSSHFGNGGASAASINKKESLVVCPEIQLAAKIMTGARGKH